MVPGTDAAALSVARDTAIPPAGAAAFRVTVPVADPPPPMSDVGLTERADGPIAVTERVAVRLLGPTEAFSVTAVVAETSCVVTGALAEVAPWGIVTLEGTKAAALDDESAIDSPPLGAGALMVTLAVVFSTPPINVAWPTVKDAIVYGLTVTVVVFDEP